MSAKIRSGSIAGLPPAERFAAVRPYQGRLCEVTFRGGTYAAWRVELVRVVGASHHATNGNSTGDLVVAPAEADNVFVFGDADKGVDYRAPLKSISLANVKSLKVVAP